MQNPHPLFVHFPIALLFVAIALDLLAWIARRDSLRNCATACLVFGALGALVAMATGLDAADSVPHPEAAHEIMETHEKLGIAVFIIAALLSIVRLLKWDRKAAAKVIVTGVLAATVGLVSFGAYLGGRLVFDFGVGTALVTRETLSRQHVEEGPPPSLRDNERGEEGQPYQGEQEEEGQPHSNGAHSHEH